MNLVKIFSMLWILIGLVETFAPIANAGQDPVLENELARAAMEFKVPYLLLHSIARVESGGEHRLPKDEDPRNDRKSPPSYGVMGLRNDAWFGKSLLKSAQLLGRNSDDLIMDRKTNIRAAAAYLRSLAMEEDARGGSISMDAQTALTKNLLPWSKVIERYSGIPGADAK